MPVTNISSAPDFKRAIAQSKLTVVDFFAVWCGPCKAVAPRLEEMSNTYRANALFYKVNVEDLKSCGVRAMPTFHLYRNSKLLKEIVGANVTALEDAIKQNLAPEPFSSGGRVLGTGQTVGGGGASSYSTQKSFTNSPITPASTGSDSASATANPAAPAANSNMLFLLALVFMVFYYFVGMRNNMGEEPMY
ncbi:thioredoxin trx1 [Sorochytrium milnesiophthora]